MNLPRCRLYLRVPEDAEPGRARACLAAAVEAGDVAALLVGGDGREEKTIAMFEALKPIARERDLAVVVARDAGLAQRLGADGVEVADRAACDAARRLMGASAIVGADCAASRHLAMELAEAGADYVGFANAADGGLERVEWWAELFEVPCVALDGVEPETAAALARLGADFVRPAQSMWDSPESARETVIATLRAIDEAVR